ncbi:MAG: hypothetical protein HYS13_25915, partial [Planctomycetia bacterium]|nr:hypothetical protein [Planctomycetia bacterium]
MKLLQNLLGIAILIWMAAVVDRAPAAEPIDLGARRELFVDHFLIERLQGASLRLHTPRDEGLAFKFDRPWEGLFCAYVTILKDGDKFRAYYRGMPSA